MKRLLIAVALVTILSAQTTLQKKWTALTTTGTTALFSVPGYTFHTVQAIVTGSPSGCTMHLEGSLDTVNWADLSGDQTCTSTVMFHVTSRAVAAVRVNLTALTGGTSPTVTIYYQGR